MTQTLKVTMHFAFLKSRNNWSIMLDHPFCLSEEIFENVRRRGVKIFLFRLHHTQSNNNIELYNVTPKYKTNKESFLPLMVRHTTALLKVRLLYYIWINLYGHKDDIICIVYM